MRFEYPSPDAPRLGHERPGQPFFDRIKLGKLTNPLVYAIPDTGMLHAYDCDVFAYNLPLILPLPPDEHRQIVGRGVGCSCLGDAHGWPRKRRSSWLY